MLKEKREQVRKAKAKVGRGVLKKVKVKAKAKEKDPDHLHQREERIPQERLRMENLTDLHAIRMRKVHALEESCAITGMHQLANFG